MYMQKGDRYYKESASYAKVKRFVQLHESKSKNDNALIYRKPIPADSVQVCRLLYVVVDKQACMGKQHRL